MKFTVYLLWTISAPFFAGGIVWAIAPVFMPMWAIAIGMIAHLAIWASVQETLTENGWDN